MLISARNLTAGKIDKALACTGRYCTGQRAAIMNDQLLEQAAIESLAAGLAHRYVDKDEITHNNLRWEKREQFWKSVVIFRPKRYRMRVWQQVSLVHLVNRQDRRQRVLWAFWLMGVAKQFILSVGNRLIILHTS